MNPDHAIADLSVRQGGFVRRDQAVEFGLTRDQIAYRVKVGRWKRVGKYGYQLLDMSKPLDRVRAAVAALPSAVASHQAAAEIHSIPRVPRGIAVVSVHSQTTHAFPGVVVRRNHDLSVEDLIEVEDLPVTTAARTIVDLAALLSVGHLAAIVDDALAAQQTSIGELISLRERVARRGKPGIASLRKVLDHRAPGPEGGTALERLGSNVLFDGGLPEPKYEYPIPWEEEERRFDAAYPDHRVAIEWDSIRWHLKLDAFQRDRERDRLAAIHGWRILRFTWADLTERPQEVVSIVRAALAANRGL